MTKRIVGLIAAITIVLFGAVSVVEPASAAPRQSASAKAEAAQAATAKAKAKAKAAKAEAAKDKAAKAKAAKARAARLKAQNQAKAREADALFRLGKKGVALTRQAATARAKGREAAKQAAIASSTAASAARKAVTAKGKVDKLRKVPKNKRDKKWQRAIAAAKSASKKATSTAVKTKKTADAKKKRAAKLIRASAAKSKEALIARSNYAAKAPARAKVAARSSARAKARATSLTSAARTARASYEAKAKTAASLKAKADRLAKDKKATKKAKAKARAAAVAAAKSAAKAYKIGRSKTAVAIKAKASARSRAAFAAKTRRADGRFPTWKPRDSLIFNNPRGSKAKKLAIIRQINKAIDATPAGGEIRMVQYLFNIGSVASKLIAANKRGASVQVLVDDGENNRHIRRVKRALGRDKSKRSFVAVCDHSCMSSGTSTIHSKYYMFSVTGSQRWVSMISSANPYTGNTYNSWNNNHTIANDTKIYFSLNRYFTDMLRDKDDPNYFRVTRSGKYTMYLYPQTPRRPNDLVLNNVLNHTSCKAKKGYGTNGKTMIRLANWGWSTTRNDVANRLWTLFNQGCKVQVMVNKGRISRGVLKVLLKRSPRYGKMPVYDAWYDKNNNNVAGLYVHDKVLTVSGTLNGRSVKHTWTGSQNLTALGTLANNDIILRVNDANVTHDYNVNFAYIRKNYTNRMYSVPWRTRVPN